MMNKSTVTVVKEDPALGAKKMEEKALDKIKHSTLMSAIYHEITSLSSSEDSFPPTLEEALNLIKSSVKEYKNMTDLIGISSYVDEVIRIELEKAAGAVIQFYVKKFTFEDEENKNYYSELEQVKKSDYYRDFIKRPRCVGKQEKRAGRQECNGEKQSGRNGINNKNDKENPEIQHIRHLLDIIERTIEGELTEQDVIELKQDANNWDEDIKKLKKMIASLNIDSIIQSRQAVVFQENSTSASQDISKEEYAKPGLVKEDDSEYREV